LRVPRAVRPPYNFESGPALKHPAAGEVEIRRPAQKRLIPRRTGLEVIDLLDISNTRRWAINQVFPITIAGTAPLSGAKKIFTSASRARSRCRKGRIT
jgi:hypothetical protein